MSTKNISQSEEQPELIRCDNCRQDINSKIMFLHEGFCHKNNVFCEHCEKVFLKQDYEQHIKDLPNNLTSNKMESPNNSKKSTSNEEETPVMRNSVTINPNPSIEYVSMPWVEEYTINAPIIISENGQILSHKNKNEYILPILGINPIPNNQFYEESDDYENEDIFTTYKTKTYTVENFKSFLNTNDFDINSFLGTNSNQMEQDNINNDINFYGNNNNFNYLNEVKTFNNNYNGNNTNYINNYDNYNDSYNDNYNDSYNDNNNYNINYNEANKPYNRSRNSKIISYDNYENMNVINSYFVNDNSPKRIDNENENNRFNYFYSEDINEIQNLNNKPLKKTPKNKKSSKRYDLSKSKEPRDSKSRLLTEPKPQIKKRKKKENKTICKSDKKKIIKKLCQYCKIMVDDLSSHYEICKSKNSAKSVKQKKDVIDSVILNEMLTNQSIEESTIGDNKKQILKREITSPIHPSVIDRDNFPSEEIYYFSRTESNNKNSQNYEEPKILSIKKNLFPKVFPLKVKKEKKLIRIHKKKNKKSKIKKKKEDNSRSFNNSQKNNINYFENSPLLSNRVDNVTYLSDYKTFSYSSKKDNLNNSKNIDGRNIFIKI